MMRKVLTAAVGVAAFAALSIAAAPAAMAHDTIGEVYGCGSGGAKRCGYGGVTNNHHRVYSCDTYGDHYGIRVYYSTTAGTPGYIDDANGSSSGCSERTIAATIAEYQVCHTGNGRCSAQIRP